MADAPLTALEQALTVALVEARSIAHAQPIGLTPTYHNQLRRAGEKRPYNMADAKRDARNAVTAIERAFEALIAYQAVPATPSPPVAAPPATPVAPTDETLLAMAREAGMFGFEDRGTKPLLRFARAVLAATQPQPQPAQPLTGAREQGVTVGPVGLELLIAEINKLPAVRAAEIDGEESDGTPRHWRDRPHVSLRKLERLLREFFTPPPVDAPTPPEVAP